MDEPEISSLAAHRLAQSTAQFIAQLIAQSLAQDDFVFFPDALPPSFTQALLLEAQQLDDSGAFTAARVGRGSQTQHNVIRGDRLYWLEKRQPQRASHAWLDLLDTIVSACNQHLLLNLAEAESHFAIYPPNAGYARHLDRFRDDDARVISIVAYLNPTWQPDHGGRLLCEVNDAVQTVEPRAGTLVAFLSDRVPHAVQTSHATRYSLAAWLRRRGQV
jgi:SM-20-related protein